MSTPFITRNQVVDHLSDLHRRFFDEFGVDPHTGMPRRFPRSGWRFATLPHVGSRYCESTRILFVSLYIHRDHGHVQSFDTRRRLEELQPTRMNPHIAGTWCQALALLPPELGWDEIAASEMPCKTLLLRTPMADWKVNPLSLVGLTNWYKWVRLGGAGARHHLDPVIERAFLVDEIQCYEPDIVVFQSASFRTRTYLPLVKTVARQFKVVVMYHPSRRGTLGHHMRSPGDLARVLWP